MVAHVLTNGSAVSCLGMVLGSVVWGGCLGLALITFHAVLYFLFSVFPLFCYCLCFALFWFLFAPLEQQIINKMIGATNQPVDEPNASPPPANEPVDTSVVRKLALIFSLSLSLSPG